MHEIHRYSYPGTKKSKSVSLFSDSGKGKGFLRKGSQSSQFKPSLEIQDTHGEDNTFKDKVKR